MAQPPKKYLELSDEDLQKVSRNRSKKEEAAIDEQQLFIAEFGKHYGWAAVMAILNNEIDIETATWLTLAARKVDARTTYDTAQAVLIGSGSAQSKTPSVTFKKATGDLKRQMKADV